MKYMAKDPFSPSFGTAPPLLVGRDDIIQDFEYALENGPGQQGRASLYVGNRGVGKTVLLAAIRERAKRHGWIVLAETATPGFIDRLALEHIPTCLNEIGAAKTKSRIVGGTLSFAGGGVTWERGQNQEPVMQTLSGRLRRLVQAIPNTDTGVVITLDEVNADQAGEMREFAKTLQDARVENLNVAFVGAGLPSNVSAVLVDKVITFFQRTEQHELGAVELSDVKRAIREPIEANGRSIGIDALDAMARGTGGYPFLIQLIGSGVWRQHPDEPEITMTDVEAGLVWAHKRLGSQVYDLALRDTSAIDRSYLVAMARDDGPSRTVDVATRLGKGAGYGGVYRDRLITAGLITAENLPYGMVDFKIPYLRGYLREHAVSLAPRLEEIVSSGDDVAAPQLDNDDSGEGASSSRSLGRGFSIR
ncbi:MAG: ATP-binding protein [Ferrimicrobium acidiphilum]